MNKTLSIDADRRRYLLRRYILLTGATGLVGQYLLRDLLLLGYPVAVVVRRSRHATASQRIEAIMQRWEQELRSRLPRPVVLSGDVCDKDLGLVADDQEWIGQNCDQIVHSAAILKFHPAPQDTDPWKTNLGGTGNVLALARRTNIKRFHYVSTAYVCGQRQDRVWENQLDCGQTFRNDYERSKFAAESLVHAADHLESRTIFRPAVIVGDSQTGFTASYHGLFLYLRLMATLIPQQERNADGIIETPIRLPLCGDEPHNLVTVDWVSRVISQIVNNREAHGRTYHLSPDECITTRQVIDFCCEYFNTTGVEYSHSHTESRLDNQFSRRVFENIGIYQPYERNDPEFDKSNVQQFAGQIACPRIDKDMIFRFIKFAVADRWGKQRLKRKPSELAPV